MAKFFFLFILFFSFTFSAQLVINEKQIVAEGFGSSHPQIELINNTPIITWTDNTSKNIYFSKLNGSEFTTPLKLNPDLHLVQSYSWSGPDLFVSNDVIHVVYRSEDYENGHVFYTKSIDYGQTFQTPIQVDNLQSGFAQYPDITVFNDTLFVTFMQHDANGMNPKYVLTRSFDGGNTFESPIEASSLTGDEVCDCCQPEIVVNEKYLAIFFRNNDNNIRDIKGVVSYNRGDSFVKVANIDNHLWYVNACPSTGSDAKFLGTEDLISVYKTSINGQGKTFVSKYNIINDQLVDDKSISDEITGGGNYPQISISNDTIGIVFEGIGNSSDIYFLSSYTGYDGINRDNRINITNEQGSQSKPDIVHGNRKFHVVYAETDKLFYINLEETLSNAELEKTITQKSLVLYKNVHFDVELKHLYAMNGKYFDLVNVQQLEVGVYFQFDEKNKEKTKILILPE